MVLLHRIARPHKHENTEHENTEWPTLALRQASEYNIALVPPLRRERRNTMRRRIYWLLPDLRSARRAMDHLLLARIENRHIHFLARDGTDLSGVHEANVLQSSDLVRSAQVGLLLGAAIGAAAGATLAVSQLIGDVSKPALVGALAALGSLFGAWASSMIGASTPSRRLRRFEAALQRGEILLMVDVPHQRVEEIEKLLEHRDPKAHLEGQEPDIPAFP